VRDVGAGPVTTHNDFWRPDLSGNTMQTYHYLHYPRLRALSRPRCATRSAAPATDGAAATERVILVGCARLIVACCCAEGHERRQKVCKAHRRGTVVTCSRAIYPTVAPLQLRRRPSPHGCDCGGRARSFGSALVSTPQLNGCFWAPGLEPEQRCESSEPVQDRNLFLEAGLRGFHLE